MPDTQHVAFGKVLGHGLEDAGYISYTERRTTGSLDDDLKDIGGELTSLANAHCITGLETKLVRPRKGEDC